jgi:hypothetical protein
MMIEAHEVDVLVGDTLEEALDILNLQWHGLVLGEDGANLGNSTFTRVLLGLGSTASILMVFTTKLDICAALDYLGPSYLSTAAKDIPVVLFVDKELGAANTDAPEDS